MERSSASAYRTSKNGAAGSTFVSFLPSSASPCGWYAGGRSWRSNGNRRTMSHQRPFNPYDPRSSSSSSSSLGVHSPADFATEILTSSSSSSSSSLPPLSSPMSILPEGFSATSSSSLSSSLSSSFVWLSEASTATAAAAPKEFEPITDWNALGTFASIMLVFLLLVRRTAAVERAVVEREAALELVRDLKSKALEGTSTSAAAVTTNTDGVATPNDSSKRLNEALERYEAAVVQEERLRNIVPGVVRIVPPSSGTAAEENAQAAARQFLGKDYDIGVPKQERTPDGKLPMIALGILAVLGVSLTGLLFLLSVDPDTASSFLKDL